MLYQSGMYEDAGTETKKTKVPGLLKVITLIRHRSSYRRDGGRVFPGHAPEEYVFNEEPINRLIGSYMDELNISSPQEVKSLLAQMEKLKEETRQLAQPGGEDFYVRQFFAEKEVRVVKKLKEGVIINPAHILGYVQYYCCSGSLIEWDLFDYFK